MFLRELAVLIYLTVVVWGQNSSSTSTTLTPPTTTQTVEELCASQNSSCGQCTSYAQCLWCPSKSPGCLPYPVGSVIPRSSYCSLDEARWGVCWVNYKILLIVMGCFAGVIIISVMCCCYCCCCKSKGSKRKYREEEAKLEEQREQRRAKNDEKRKERQSKYDEIRRKYGITSKNAVLDEDMEGLMKDDETGGNKKYQRFDNEA